LGSDTGRASIGLVHQRWQGNVGCGANCDQSICTQPSLPLSPLAFESNSRTAESRQHEMSGKNQPSHTSFMIIGALLVGFG
jgi:hypothetical protein